jgi:signal peptidase I
MARVVFLCVFGGLFFSLVLRPVWTDGVSMEPTVPDRSLHFANMLAYRVSPPTRGDVVVIGGNGRKLLYLKRILGLPGERIEFRDGALYIDSRRMKEPYLRDAGDWTMPPQEIGPGAYFVAGDNRTVEIHRHMIGFVERRRITGKLIL